MHDLTSLPDPPCGDISPDGDTCPSESTVIVAAEWPTGYSVAVWRCHDHAGTSVDAALRLHADAVITVTPLTTIDRNEPAPDSPTTGQPPLRLLR
jgi:hypothetical protein